MHRIVSFMKINLEEHHRSELFTFDLVDYPVENKDPIQNITALSEGRLVRMVYPRSNKGRPSGVPLS